VLLSMEIVVRTPHGDADVSIVSASADTTVGGVVAAVTGQAMPRLVQIDDHVVDATTPLDDAGLLAGSVVTSEPSVAPVASGSDVDLVQIAGHGAGRISRLGPGRYRIGPGRRSSADELTLAPVEHTMFELVVEPAAAASSVAAVTVVAEQPASADPATEVLIDGIRVDHPTRWSNGTLRVGRRAFQIDTPARLDPPRTLSAPDRDGAVQFSRPPRRPSSAPRRPVVDAVSDATGAVPTLWERRPGHPDAFALPIGIRDDDHTEDRHTEDRHTRDDRTQVVTVDLGAERAVAITGSETFRSSLARTLLIEMVTLHGPADVDLVVLTDADRSAQWDWAKWLPHVRLDGTPAIWSSRREVGRWVDGSTERATSASWISPHVTVAIVDDPALWSRRDSPLRSIMADPPDDLRLIALCDDPTHAPAICTTVVSETSSGLARLQSFTRPEDGCELYPSLAEQHVAMRVARALAPLTDVELPPASPATSRSGDHVDASALIGVAGPDDVEARWAANTPRTAVPIGRSGGEPVTLDVSDDVTVVLGSSIGDAFDVAATSLLGQAVDRSPDELWVAPIVRSDSERSAWWSRLPHATEPHPLDVDVDEARLLARLRAVLADPDGPDRIVVVVEATSASPTPDIAWLDALGDGVRSTTGLALVVVTDHAEMAGLGDTVVAVDHRAALRGSARRRDAVITTGDGVPSPTFAPLQRSASASAMLVVEPFVIGRALSALERRIDQQRARAANSPDPALGPIVDLLRDAASRRPTHAVSRMVVPPAMPSHVDLDVLFETSPGDGVPLGLLDDPAAAGARVVWWEPGRGSMLVFGSRRSGVDQVPTTLLLGLVDRFSDLDVRLVVVEASATLRQAITGIDRSVRVVAPDQADDVADALDEIDAESNRRASGADGPRTVVLIDDLVQLRARYADHPLGARIDDVLTRATVGSAGVDVVAWAHELDGAGPFAANAAHRLVGASSNHDELRALGVERPHELDGVRGRCRSFPDGGLVQLATADTSTETLLARRAIGQST
jgi:S-DNA-T family DNA segregation ATPase FtsK/SpoIIIE